uniref:Uncharacterized protein n=1 Tax=Moniliophthora roreri TaxID=221103 RepID=A0A0W0FG37_MONRR
MNNSNGSIQGKEYALLHTARDISIVDPSGV